MWRPSDPTKFSSKFKYVEFGRYDPKGVKDKKTGEWKGTLKRDVIIHRDDSGEITQRDIKLMTWEEAIDRASKYDNTGVYTSTFQYAGTDINALSMSSLYFDFDSDDIAVSHVEAQRVYQYLLGHVSEEAIRLYFTGKKGFHVEAEAVALGIGPSADLAGVFRHIGNDLRDQLGLVSMDFQVFDPRRMWRIPNTRHQLTGLYKVPITGTELLGAVDEVFRLAEQPRSLEVPEQKFSLKANEWFMGYVYDYAKPQYSHEDLIERFNKAGTGRVRDVGETEFTPVRLFENCPAIMRLWEKAEREHDLDHEERLLLCSILTYDDLAIEYLHRILEQCSDYS